MEWLKKLFGDDIYNQLFPQDKAELLKKVTDKIGSKKILIEEKEGDWIPKARFDEVNTKKADLEKELTTTKETLTTIQKEVETLKGDKDGGKKTLEEQVTNLTKQITDMQNQIKEKDTQLNLRDRRSLIENTLRGLKANEKYLPTLLREFEAKYPLDKIEIVDGKIKDVDNILKPFQESYKDLFGEVKRQGFDPKNGGDNGAGDYYSLDQLKSMTKQEIAANMEKVDKSLAYHNQGT